MNSKSDPVYVINSIRSANVESHATALLHELNEAWKQLASFPKGDRNILKFRKGDKADKALLVFNTSLQMDDDLREEIINGISRGQSLVRSSLEWETPFVGSTNNRSGNMRGAFWRLMIAWSGFEVLVNVLSGNSDRAAINHVLQTIKHRQLVWPDLTPTNTKEVQRLLSTKTRAGKLRLDNVLLSGGEDVKKHSPSLSIKKWIVNQNPLNDIRDHIYLAKSIRNSIAHGSLTPNRALKLGITNGILSSTLLCGHLTVEILKRLRD